MEPKSRSGSHTLGLPLRIVPPLSFDLAHSQLDLRRGKWLKVSFKTRYTHFMFIFLCGAQELKDKITEEKGYARETQRLYLKNQELDEALEVKDLVSYDSLDSNK